MDRLKFIVWWLLRKLGLGPVLLRIHPKSALRELGWFRSFRRWAPVDRFGAPIPWWTYPVVHFLEARLRPSFRVLEFGSGHSTLWLSQRVREVIAVESDGGWAARIRARLPSNGRVVLSRTPETFATEAGEELGLFDLIVIDGVNRMEVAKSAFRLLSDTGVIVWDDTERTDWPDIRALLEGRGFREISFRGLRPQVVHISRTTVFYRELNCLGV